jgi:hypothetical protein
MILAVLKELNQELQIKMFYHVSFPRSTARNIHKIFADHFFHDGNVSVKSFAMLIAKFFQVLREKVQMRIEEM